MYSTEINEILLTTATIREVNSTEKEKQRIARHYSAEHKQPNKLSQLQNTQLNLLVVTFLTILK